MPKVTEEGGVFKGWAKARLDSLEKINDGRFRALEARIDQAQQFPTLLDQAKVELKDLIEVRFLCLRELTDEKFSGVEHRFSDRDVRFRQGSDDNKQAVAAALESNKQSIQEQRLAVARQIEALQDRIGDLKDRVVAIEGQRHGGNQLWSYIVGGIGALIGIISLVTILTGTVPRDSATAPRIVVEPAKP